MTAPHHPNLDDALIAAREDHASVVALTRALIRVPSRGGIDSYEPVLEILAVWLADHHLTATTLRDPDGAIVGLACEIAGKHPGPRWVLDACMDTAVFGDETAWTHPPTSAAIVDGWLWGRGAADSKIAAAIFCHIAARLATITERLHGRAVLLFDVDEHTGGFGGAKRYFEGPGAPRDVAGVLIGYPGIGHVVIGGRGVHRVRLHVHGVASHSGGRAATPNAIVKAADLITALSDVELPRGASPDFPLHGKITTTAIDGGQGFSVTPDVCVVNVDVRTTPAFDNAAAADLIGRVVAEVDRAWPDTRATRIELDTQWPPYALEESSPLRGALLGAARAAGLDVQPKIAGPSNIGNYLAGLGIPATAGFGVDYVGLHATDERCRIDTIPTVHAVYQHALLTLLIGER
ncbi:M20 family metallopeptidase [Amycolatopsis azurea]|uniref:M20 family metallopeptidase n=1 Tax=Amycolatopsis azurea TaxID=36819 RepID=UPI003817DE18